MGSVVPSPGNPVRRDGVCPPRFGDHPDRVVRGTGSQLDPSYQQYPNLKDRCDRMGGPAVLLHLLVVGADHPLDGEGRGG